MNCLLIVCQLLALPVGLVALCLMGFIAKMSSVRNCSLQNTALAFHPNHKFVLFFCFFFNQERECTVKFSTSIMSYFLNYFNMKSEIQWWKETAYKVKKYFSLVRPFLFLNSDLNQLFLQLLFFCSDLISS